MTPNDHDAFEHPEDACRLAELCPDLYPEEEHRLAFAAVTGATLTLLHKADLPPTLVAWHLLAAAAQVAIAAEVDAGTLIRAFQQTIDLALESKHEARAAEKGSPV